ncbi:MAG TPA: class I SAM-dependent methyltransferase [Candidatus Methylomirabilis sp.]|nr:class I SAM-dependent methyltransferase [Candidatus Methylomirabilis sp.]HSC70252.1 class I SAM-dependent methyltransferase [Candidatus Methylomirabilis sp.]
MSEAHDLVREQFGAHAKEYATSPVHAQGGSLARLVELTQPQATWLMLDVSTGAGHTAFTFAPHVARVIATDLTPQMLDAARTLAVERGVTNVEFRPADAQDLPFEANVFDLVTNRIALHHYPEARKAIEEMVRVCKSDGAVALVDNVVPPEEETGGYINQFERLRDPSHHRAYPVAHLEAFFVEAKLKLAQSETMLKHMEFEPWARRMGASEDTKARLRRMLLEAPDPVRDFLMPRTENGRLLFTLTEAVIIGRRD